MPSQEHFDHGKLKLPSGEEIPITKIEITSAAKDQPVPHLKPAMVEMGWKILRKLREQLLAAANADKTPIRGGVDEPGLKPLRSGEKTHVFIDARGPYRPDMHAEALECLDGETALTVIARYRATNRELCN